MSEEQKEIQIYESRRFEKSVSKLTQSRLKIVEDEIDKIIEDPEIGDLKKGDLLYLRVHEFRMGDQQMLLGYSWLDAKIEIYLLHLGTH